MKQVAASESESESLSDLPEHVLLHIISFLPTKLAARTSLLSRRFRRLWESSPVLDLDILAFRDLRCSDLVDLANRTILQRDPPSPLHRLSLNLYSSYWYDETLLTPSYISSLLLKAASLGVRHLTVRLGFERRGHWDMHLAILPLIFSIRSLQTLFLDLEGFNLEGFKKVLYGPRFPISTLTHLKSLSICTCELHSDVLNYITSHLNALEDLHLQLNSAFVILKIVGVKRLKLAVDCYHLDLSSPTLELFEFVGICCYIQWEMPMLKKAIVQLKEFSPIYVPNICKLLKAVAHVEELHLDIKESECEGRFHAFLLPGVDLPTFVTLKHLNLEVRFHEYNIEDLVTLLEHSPSLESLNLVHKPLVYYRKYKRNYFKKKKIWRSKLPRNADGKNCRHAYFKDLHIDEKRKELIDQLIREIPKKQKA